MRSIGRLLATLVMMTLGASAATALPPGLVGSSGWSEGLVGIEYTLGDPAPVAGGFMVWNPRDRLSFGFGLTYRVRHAPSDHFPLALYLDLRGYPFRLGQDSFDLPLVVRLGIDMSDVDGSLWVDGGIAADWFPASFSSGAALLAEARAAGRVAWFSGRKGAAFLLNGGLGFGVGWPNSGGSTIIIY